jgi:hypothetical protein
MTSDGFEVVARYAHWNGSGDRNCVVFQARGTPAAVPAAGGEE